MQLDALVAECFPPDKFELVGKVPIFDEHESPHKDRPKKITPKDLQNLAEGCNSKFENLKAATAVVLGHTKDPETTKEEDQPPVIGYAVNFAVDDLLNTGKKALFADWYIKKDKLHELEEYPHRSIELFPSRNDINPISLLRIAPERDLPIIRYQAERDELALSEGREVPIRYSFTPPIKETPTVTDDKDMDKKEETKVTETSGFKEMQASMQGIMEALTQQGEMLAKLNETLTSALTNMDDDDDDQDDLLDFADADQDDNYDEGKDMEEDKKPDTPEKKDRMEDSVDYGGHVGPDSSYTPSTENKKVDKYNRQTDENEEVVQYRRRVEELERQTAEYAVQFARQTATAEVDKLEREDNVDFVDRDGEVDFLTRLLTSGPKGKEAFQAKVDNIKAQYKRKEPPKPDSNGLLDVVQYGRTADEKTGFSSPQDIMQYQQALALNPKLTPVDWHSSRTGVGVTKTV